MKYLTPRYEVSAVETEDILTPSVQAPKYEVVQKTNGEGDVIMNAFDLFR